MYVILNIIINSSNIQLKLYIKIYLSKTLTTHKAKNRMKTQTTSTQPKQKSLTISKTSQKAAVQQQKRSQPDHKTKRSNNNNRPLTNNYNNSSKDGKLRNRSKSNNSKRNGNIGKNRGKIVCSEKKFQLADNTCYINCSNQYGKQNQYQLNLYQRNHTLTKQHLSKTLQISKDDNQNEKQNLFFKNYNKFANNCKNINNGKDSKDDKQKILEQLCMNYKINPRLISLNKNNNSGVGRNGYVYGNQKSKSKNKSKNKNGKNVIQNNNNHNKNINKNKNKSPIKTKNPINNSTIPKSSLSISYQNSISKIFNILDIFSRGTISQANITRWIPQAALYFLGTVFQNIRANRSIINQQQFYEECLKIYEKSSVNDIQEFISNIQRFGKGGEDVVSMEGFQARDRMEFRETIQSQVQDKFCVNGDIGRQLYKQKQKYIDDNNYNGQHSFRNIQYIQKTVPVRPNHHPNNPNTNNNNNKNQNQFHLQQLRQKQKQLKLQMSRTSVNNNQNNMEGECRIMKKLRDNRNFNNTLPSNSSSQYKRGGLEKSDIRKKVFLENNNSNYSNYNHNKNGNNGKQNQNSNRNNNNYNPLKNQNQPQKSQQKSKQKPKQIPPLTDINVFQNVAMKNRVRKNPEMMYQELTAGTTGMRNQKNSVNDLSLGCFQDNWRKERNNRYGCHDAPFMEENKTTRRSGANGNQSPFFQASTLTNIFSKLSQNIDNNNTTQKQSTMPVPNSYIPQIPYPTLNQNYPQNNIISPIIQQPKAEQSSISIQAQHPAIHLTSIMPAPTISMTINCKRRQNKKSVETDRIDKLSLRLEDYIKKNADRIERSKNCRVGL